MSVHELNHLMTYVIEGWMLFSAGFTSVAFVSFVARRIQEDEAAIAQANAQLEAQTQSVSETEDLTVAATAPVSQAVENSKAPKTPKPKAPKSKAPKPSPSDTGDEQLTDEAEEAARLEEVAAVSEKLAKAKEKQSNASSVSVST